jgi:outer membrane putative beta-barrel porin/alpha-amylase
MAPPRRFLRAAAALTVALVAVSIATLAVAHAQTLEPRSYVNTPTGLNFLLLGYGYVNGEVGVDESSPIKDTKVEVHAGLAAYARSLDVWGLSGKVLAVLPFAEVSGHAKANGQARDRDVFGLADPLFRVSVNLYGAPALTLEEFSAYRQDVILGASLQVTAPLGQYDSSKLLNVGSNRWSVKPELGMSKAWGTLTLELIPAVTFYTDNNDFFGGKTLKQDPIYSVQAHLIYQFFPSLWAALDSTYYTGGRTRIDGEVGERQENVRLGVTAAFSLTRYQSIKFHGSTGIYNRTDNNFWTLGLAWQYRWGAGL